MLIEHVRRQPLLQDRDHGLGLGLRLGQEVPVQVEVVAVRPLAQDAPVRVLIDVPEQDHVVQDGVDLGIRAVRRRRQLLDQLEHGVHAFVLVAVDGRLDEDRDLHVVAGPVEHALSPLRLGQGDLADVLPGLEVLPLLGRVEGVDRDQIQVVTERRLAEDPDLHPPVAPRLDVGEGAGEGVHGDVREAANRIAGVAAVRK